MAERNRTASNIHHLQPNPDAEELRLRRGRGAVSNPTGRFESQHRVRRDGMWDYRSDSDWQSQGGLSTQGGDLDLPPLPPLRTSVIEEACRSAIVHNSSPDIPFDQSINPYRGCEHGCIYCYARPSHAYSGLSAGLDFETRLFSKPDIVETLKKELANPKYKCRMIALGTNTDCYQPVEREHGLMRGILETLHDARHPVGIVTKSHLVTRDIDLLADMAKDNLVHVFMSVTTLDRSLARAMEPRAATPPRRLDAIRQLAAAGIPVGVMVAPVVPALTDHEMENILAAAQDAGAKRAGYLVLRLPFEIKELFREWLLENCPDRATRVLRQIHEIRGGRDNDPRFHTRMTGVGDNADLLASRFDIACRKLGLSTRDYDELETSLFTPPVLPGRQFSLF
jgi:DNA repair photolyase